MSTATASASLYETDFYGWVQQQVAMLRGRKVNSLDFENLIEEVESMGRSEKRELESRLEVLLMHLLKWQYQPERRGKSWQLAIEGQRDRLAGHLRENPSLKGKLPACLQEAYRHAKREAIKETGLPAGTFPPECPWTFDVAINDGFWPQVSEPGTPSGEPVMATTVLTPS